MTGSPAAQEPVTDEKSLAVQAHALRAAASLIEHAGIPGLSLTVNADRDQQITIQVPTYLGSPAERTTVVTRLAAAVGGTTARDAFPGPTRGCLIRADGKVDGHTVHIFTGIYTPVLANEPQETAPDGDR
jgi:hypothetical protein